MIDPRDAGTSRNRLYHQYIASKCDNRNVTSGHYLGLTDRLQLGTDLIASCAKLLYAFLWQVDLMLILTQMLIYGTDLLASCAKLLYAFLWQFHVDIAEIFSNGDADIDKNVKTDYRKIRLTLVEQI